MLNKTKIIASIAAALLAGVMIATPAGAQAAHEGGGGGAQVGGDGGGGSRGGGGGSAGGFGGGGGGGAAQIGGGGGRSGGAPRFNGSGRHVGDPSAPAARGPALSGRSGFAYNGRHHGNRQHSRRSAPVFGFFGWGAPFAYDYWDDPYYYGPDCYWRHVRYHHRWIWRLYCD